MEAAALASSLHSSFPIAANYPRKEESLLRSIYFFNTTPYSNKGGGTEPARLKNTHLQGQMLVHFILTASLSPWGIQYIQYNTDACACTNPHSGTRPILTEKTDLLSCSRHHVLSVSYRCHSDAAQTARESSQVWMAEPAMNSSVCHSQWTVSRLHNSPPQWIAEISGFHGPWMPLCACLCLCVCNSSADKRSYHIMCR